MPRSVNSCRTTIVKERHAFQLTYYRQHVDPEIEIARPRCYPRPVQFLLEFKLSKTLELLGEPLAGWTTLVVGAGSGMDSEYLARQGLWVIGADLSLEALCRAKERARRYGVNYDLVVADAEHLPFRADAVNLAFVHDCLHHLPDPFAAVREMARVSSKAVAIAEPANSPLTRLAVWLGITSDWEDVGNYVYRLRATELGQLLTNLGFRKWRASQHLIYYQPWTFKIYRLMEKPALFALFKVGFYLSNWLIGRWGNSLKFVAWRSEG